MHSLGADGHFERYPVLQELKFQKMLAQTHAALKPGYSLKFQARKNQAGVEKLFLKIAHGVHEADLGVIDQSLGFRHALSNAYLDVVQGLYGEGYVDGIHQTKPGTVLTKEQRQKRLAHEIVGETLLKNPNAAKLLLHAAETMQTLPKTYPEPIIKARNPKEYSLFEDAEEREGLLHDGAFKAFHELAKKGKLPKLDKDNNAAVKKILEAQKKKIALIARAVK